MSLVQTYEDKRKLVASYDLFLVDRRVLTFMPKLLGKAFFKRKRYILTMLLSAHSSLPLLLLNSSCVLFLFGVLLLTLFLEQSTSANRSNQRKLEKNGSASMCLHLYVPRLWSVLVGCDMCVCLRGQSLCITVTLASRSIIQSPISYRAVVQRNQNWKDGHVGDRVV